MGIGEEDREQDGEDEEHDGQDTLPANFPGPPGLEDQGLNRNPPARGTSRGSTRTHMCAICMDPVHSSGTDTFLTPCAHIFHDHCFAKWQTKATTRAITCPICRSVISDESGVLDFRDNPGTGGSDLTYPSNPIDPDTNPSHRPTNGLYLQVNSGPDLGLPKSLPPPSTYRELLRECDPLLVVTTPNPLSRQQAEFFQGSCPWLQAEASDAYSVAEAAAIQLGLYEDDDEQIQRCQNCTQPLAGNETVTTTSGQHWHTSCWCESHPRPDQTILWQGSWPESRAAGVTGDSEQDTEENEPRPCILALGVGGSTLQAIIDELVALRLPVTIKAVSSVAPQSIPGDGGATAVCAADGAWGSRLTTRAASLSWISPSFFPTGRGRPAERRLLLAEFHCLRPWNPHEQPVLALDAGALDVKVGMLVDQDLAEACRILLARARARCGDPRAFSCREVLVKAEDRALRQEDPAPNAVQFIIGTTRMDSAEELHDHLCSILPRNLRDPGTVMWWVPSRNADFVFAPTASRAVPAVIAELRRGVACGFPPLRACMTTHGICIEGVNPAVLPGLLAAVGLNAASHSLQSVGRGPMHFPIRIAKQGTLDAGSDVEGWRISCATIDNDFLFVIDEANLAAGQIRAAVAHRVAQPCALSLVSVEQQDRQGRRPAWLIRLPAVAGQAVARWQTDGLRLHIGGTVVRARPAPPTQALDEGVVRPNEQHATAAQLQRTWDLNHSPAYAPVYIGTTPNARDGNRPEEVSAWRTTHRSLHMLAAPWVRKPSRPARQLNPSDNP